MASGVAVCDEVHAYYEKIRLHLFGDDQQDRLKMVFFKITEGKIIVDKDRCLKVKDLEGVDNVFKKLMSLLTPNTCCYALYDCCFETKETCSKDELVFIMWAPDGAPIKEKMLYASSKEAIKKHLKGIKHEWQVNDVTDIADEAALLEKLGPKGTIKKLEGRAL